MDYISASEQGIGNNVNSKRLLPRKPARHPNPVVYRKFRRGSAAAKIPRKQTQQDKVLPNNKAHINDESQEWSTTESEDEGHSVLHDEKGKQEPRMSIQKYSNNYSTKIRKKKSSHNDRIEANKEHGVSRSSSHVIYVKDMIETSDCNQQQRLTENLHSSCKSFIRFCSAQIICPQEDRSALAVKLYGVQAALLSSLGNPFENISQSMTSKSSSQILVVVSLGKAFTGFLPAMIWTGMITVSYFYTVMVVWSLAFRVPIISMLCLSFLYCLSVLVAATSGFNVIWGTFRINGVLFASLGVLSFVMILLVLVMLVLFTCWRRTNEDGVK